MATSNQFATSASNKSYVDGMDGGHDPASHHQPLVMYHIIFGTLLGLLALTVGAYYVDASKLIKVPGINLIIAMFIAVVKAFLVVWFFMNVQKSSKLVWLWAGLGFVWLLLMGGIFLDYRSREWVGVQGWQ